MKNTNTPKKIQAFRDCNHPSIQKLAWKDLAFLAHYHGSNKAAAKPQAVLFRLEGYQLVLRWPLQKEAGMDKVSQAKAYLPTLAKLPTQPTCRNPSANEDGKKKKQTTKNFKMRKRWVRIFTVHFHIYTFFTPNSSRRNGEREKYPVNRWYIAGQCCWFAILVLFKGNSCRIEDHRPVPPPNR